MACYQSFGQTITMSPMNSGLIPKVWTLFYIGKNMVVKIGKTKKITSVVKTCKNHNI